MSNIVQNEYQTNSAVSLPAKEIKFCEDMVPKVYPGQQFTILLIALGQTNSPVPTTIFWDRVHIHNEDRLSPSSNTIDNLTCTNISFRLYSSDIDSHYMHFKLYPANPCQNLIEGLTLYVHVLPCPIGFDLSLTESRCVCARELKKVIQNCYIGSNSESLYVE